MISPNGFTTDPAFHQDGTAGSGSVLDTSHLFYNGNSQGGIMGGALTAVSPDFTRASLGVPAMNYSVLLPRSVDFDRLAGGLRTLLPERNARPLVLDLIQMLWDRGDPNGYAHRMTSNPLPDTPAHQVLMDVAFGDHQVTDYQADVEARTVRARAHRPVLFRAAGRTPTSSGACRRSTAIRTPARPSTTGTPARFAKNRREPCRREPPPYETCPTERRRPAGLPRATPAEQQLVSDFFEGAIPKPTTAAAAPASRSGSAARSPPSGRGYRAATAEIFRFGRRPHRGAVIRAKTGRHSCADTSRTAYPNRRSSFIRKAA